jgi:hypothetical protein
MKPDKLKKFVILRDGLLKEKVELESRLAEINDALGVLSPAEVSVHRRGRAPKAFPAAKAPKPARGRRKRAVNTVSLKDAVIAILKEKKSLGRKELLTAVVDSGYVFSASDPLNSLSTLIYGNRKIFNAKAGVISLA